MVTAYELRRLANHYTRNKLLNTLKQVAVEGRYKYCTQEWIDYDDLEALKELGFSVAENHDIEPMETTISW